MVKQVLPYWKNKKLKSEKLEKCNKRTLYLLFEYKNCLNFKKSAVKLGLCSN